MNKNKYIIFIFMCLTFCTSVFAKTGKEINADCRKNLKALNDATLEMLKNNHDTILPQWKDFDEFYKSSKLANYLKETITPPTHDCRYNLVSKNQSNFQWCCELHGVYNGDKIYTFKYHEHEISGRTNSDFTSIKEYNEHVKTMLQWTEYRQSPIEMLKYNYSTNPITTVLISIGVLIVGIIVFKKVY